jgi:peptidyl-prolyl cis-trans isomerase B (cyclophilin B)
MGVAMRKAVAVAIFAMLATSMALTQAKADTRHEATLQPTVKSLNCKSTDSVAHAPKQVGRPILMRSSLRIRTITLRTNCGDIQISTESLRAPLAVNAMAFLAVNGFFDHSLCHRLTTSGIFILQCGDPTASGQGGPAFMYRDENLPASTAGNYPAGTVAMANSGPNTNGSQFFITYQDSTLNPDYTIWGHVTRGLEIVKAIAGYGVVSGGNDGTPRQTIAVESVVIR